ncbi:NTP transferase domain-containing protein [Treponema sp. OMZ 792]|uniref:NTP transferase domain-containing protein n=1 Tax=unclassified Treponema TaxID=2638727 RepID=UPI0020A52EF8|nr:MULTISPECIES: NTP transferase domain-containing protein [unclassified Treponema]UTC75176.1 NTP transferase domain-containing protein [Treponema sp. OMZ 792]UTC79182.1 NTP transferase domain-containing protein [Treponema sp. OMZ 798]
MKISAIILASGFSKRMPQNKLKLPINGKQIFQYIVDSISQIEFTQKMVITNDAEISFYASQKNILAVPNARAEEGKSAAIKKGVENSGKAEAYMFFTADQPFLKVSTIKNLLELYSKNKEYIIYSKYGDDRGSPVIIPSKYRQDLLKLEKDKGGASLINEDNSKFLIVENTIEGFDIDDMETYEKIIKMRL